LEWDLPFRCGHTKMLLWSGIWQSSAPGGSYDRVQVSERKYRKHSAALVLLDLRRSAQAPHLLFGPDQLFVGQTQAVGHVFGKDPVEHVVYLTQHGPIIGSVYGLLDDFADVSGIEVPENYALALSWTALEPSCVFCAMWDINLAQNWQEFRDAAEYFVVPAQNLIFADVEGNIAYQMPGWIPIRSEGHDGMLPVPGWTGEYEWQGYVPFEELPYTINPVEGYIVTANNAVVGEDFPYLITKEWSLLLQIHLL